MRIPQSLMQRLRAIYASQHGGLDPRAGGGGGAYDHSISQRIAKYINLGFPPKEAEAMAQKGNRYGQSVTDDDLLKWASGNPDPRVSSILAQSGISGQSGDQALRRGPDGRLMRDAGQQSDLDRLFAETQRAQDAANAANEARYSEGKGILTERQKAAMDEMRKLRERSMGGWEGYGDAEKRLIEQRFKEQLANTTANLDQQGYGSISAAYAGRNQFDKELALGLLKDRNFQQQLQTDAALTGQLVDTGMRTSGDIASWIERRSDVAPDLSMVAQLAARYGQGNAGQGYNAGRGVAVGGYGGGGVGGYSPGVARQIAAGMGAGMAPIQQVAWNPAMYFGQYGTNAGMQQQPQGLAASLPQQANPRFMQAPSPDGRPRRTKRMDDMQARMDWLNKALAATKGA